MNLIDAAACLFIAINALIGWRRGLSGELASLISVVAAFALGLCLYRPFGDWLLHHTRATGHSAWVVAFVATVVASALAMAVLQLLLSKIGKVVIEGNVDKTLGCVAGLLRATVYVIIIFLAVNMSANRYLHQRFGQESLIGRTILKVVPSARSEIRTAPPRRTSIARWLPSDSRIQNPKSKIQNAPYPRQTHA